MIHKYNLFGLPKYFVYFPQGSNVQKRVMTLSVEAYLPAAEAIQKFRAPMRGEGKIRHMGPDGL